MVKGFTCAIILLCAGCAVGPDYHRPETRTERVAAAAWHADVYQESVPYTDDATALARWWNWFGDPLLDDLLSRAAMGSLELRAALARIEAARAERRIVAAGRGPSLGLGTAASRQQNPLPGLAEGLTFSLYEAGFDARWELDLFGRVQRRVEAAEASLAAANEDRRAIEAVLRADLVRAYWELRHADRDLALAGEAVVLAERGVELARRLVDAGLRPRRDLLVAEADAARHAAELPNLRIARATAAHQVELLCGAVPGEFTGLLAPRDSAPARITPRAILTPAAVLRERPDIRRAERELAAVTALRAAAIADLYPRVSVGLFFGARNTAIGMLLNAVSKSWNGGGNVVVPLFDSGRLRGAVAQGDARIEFALAHYERVMLGALHETELALLRLLERERERESRVLALADMREAARLADRRATQGIGTRIDVLRAERAANAAARALQASEAAITSDTVAMMKALGAGAPPPTANFAQAL
ncbi:MAG: efflux transporter outer membrane subunit [Gammaproteobacteria bacterium]